MGSDALLSTLQQVLYFTLAGALTLILPGLVVGLAIAVFQAATQINEMTLSFLPKLVLVLLLLAMFAPWFMRHIVDFTQRMILNIPYLIG